MPPAQGLDCQTKAEAFTTNNLIDQSLPRRSANYKPNIWKYELLQSLTSEYAEEKYERQAMKLREEVCMFFEEEDSLAKLERIDDIGRLGLANHFEKEIRQALDTMVSAMNHHYPITKGDLYASALCFRLLRQYGYNISQDVFMSFVNGETGYFMDTKQWSIKAMLELYEASHFASEGDDILQEANVFSTEFLKSTVKSLRIIDHKLANQLAHALDLPLQWRVDWYNVKRHINVCEEEAKTDLVLLRLAKLNFNMVQATHQKNLREVSRWWKNLGLAANLSFTRDRMVESYLWAVGVAFEPQYHSLRGWLTKAIKLVLIIDDVYDIYGSLEELERFTDAVERWDSSDIQDLPDCMKICFQALFDITTETAFEIQEEKGWKSVLPHLQQAWAGFCKALLVEARWDNKGYTPSLQEYLENGLISSSGPVLSLLAFFSVTPEATEAAMDLFNNCHELVKCTSLIIRLCNDQGTSAAELERGDAPSSILCLMREANESEEAARKHIRSIMANTWKKINSHCIKFQSPLLHPFIKCTTNAARVAHFIYQNGDGFGVQDRETRDQVLSLLLQPLPLD